MQVRQVERVFISSTNLTTWLNDSPILHSVCGSMDIPPLFNLEPGDIIYISKRKATLEVNLYVHYVYVDQLYMRLVGSNDPARTNPTLYR